MQVKLSSFFRLHAMAAVAMICLSGLLDSSRVYGQDESAGAGQSITSQDAPETQLDAIGPQRERAIEFLISEIENLTPGKFTDDLDRELVKTAVTAFADNDLEAAEAALEKFNQKNPNASPVAVMVAALMFGAGNAAEGTRRLEDAAIVYSDLPTIYNAFARVALSQRRRTDAYVLLEKANQLMKLDRWTATQRTFFETSYNDAMADLMLQRRDFGRAREFLDLLNGTEISPSRILMRIAEVDFYQDKIDDCLANLAKFKEVEPNSRVPEFMLASLYAQNGELETAGSWVEKAFTKYPNDNRVLAEYADYMISQGNFDKAGVALNKANTADAESMPVIELLQAKMAFYFGEYGKAEATLEKLFDQNQDDFEVANLWTMAMAESGQAEKVALALQMAQINVQRQPQNPVAVAILGWVYLKQNNFEQAQAWLARAAQARNVTPEVGYYLARFLQLRGENQQAYDIISGTLKHPGFFLYRLRAEQLAKELNSSGRLTPPKD